VTFFLISPLADFLHSTAEFYTESLRRLWRNWVLALPLEEIHAIETKGTDFYENLRALWGGTIGLFIDEESVGRAGTVLDVYCDMLVNSYTIVV